MTAALLAMFAAWFVGSGAGNLTSAATEQSIGAATSVTADAWGAVDSSRPPALSISGPPALSTSATPDTSGIDPLGPAPEVSQHTIGVKHFADTPVTDAGPLTIVQAKRALSLDKLHVIKDLDVNVPDWGKSGKVGADCRSLRPRSLIVLHIRLQV